MIPMMSIVAWSRIAPWAETRQIETSAGCKPADRAILFDLPRLRPLPKLRSPARQRCVESTLWKSICAFCVAAVAISASPVYSAEDLLLRECFWQAGAYYRIAPEILIAVANTESSFNASAINVNTNGSRDVGLMQINSQWFDTLTAMGIAPDQLWDPCTSIWVGAWILAQAVARHGYTWEAVGAYNAGHRRDIGADRRRAIYAHRVSRHLDRISADQRVLVTSRQSATASPSSVESSASDPDSGLRER